MVKKNNNGGGTYEHFAEFIASFAKKGDLREFNQRMSQPKFQNNPELYQKEADKFLLEIWNKRLTGTPKQRQSRNDNFEDWLDQDIKPDRKLKYDNPYTKKKEDIDLSPLFYSYREPVEKEITKVSTTGRFKDTIDSLKTKKSITRDEAIKDLRKAIVSKGLDFDTKEGKIKGDNVKDLEKLSTREIKELWAIERIKPTEGSLVNKIDNQIDNLFEGNSYEKLVKLRNSLREMAKASPKESTISSINARGLYKKIDNRLGDRYISSADLLRTKDPEKLKDLLRFKGVNISNLNTEKQIKDAAKKAGIGLRIYDKNKDELIYNILQVKKDLSKSQLQKRSLEELEKLEEDVNPTLIKPKTELYIKRIDLPTNKNLIKNLFKRQDMPFNERMFDRRVEEEAKVIKNKSPFLSQSEIQRRAKQEAITNLIFTDNKKSLVSSEEIERRFMELRYGDPDRDPSFSDLKDLSTFTNKDFKEKLKNKGDPLQKSAWRNYRDSLKSEIEKSETIINVQRKEKTKEKILDDFGVEEIAENKEEREAVRQFLGEEIEIPETVITTRTEREKIKAAREEGITGEETIKETKEGEFEIIR